jgi:hypothetical protein
MDLATIEPALLAAVSTITGLSAAACVFENAPRPIAQAVALLSWVSRSGVGIDEASWTYEAAEDPIDEMTPTVEGPRYAVLQIAVEVYADQRSGHNAASIAERARTRLMLPRVLDALAESSIAVATVGPATQADYTADGRMVSRSLFELRLNATSVATDTDGRTSYIADASITATVRDATGSTVSETLQPSG